MHPPRESRDRVRKIIEATGGSAKPVFDYLMSGNHIGKSDQAVIDEINKSEKTNDRSDE